MARADEQTNVRLPAHLKEWLKEKAATARRSVTAELILRLEESRKVEDAEHKKHAAPMANPSPDRHSQKSVQ